MTYTCIYMMKNWKYQSNKIKPLKILTPILNQGKQWIQFCTCVIMEMLFISTHITFRSALFFKILLEYKVSAVDRVESFQSPKTVYQLSPALEEPCGCRRSGWMATERHDMMTDSHREQMWTHFSVNVAKNYCVCVLVCVCVCVRACVCVKSVYVCICSSIRMCAIWKPGLLKWGDVTCVGVCEGIFSAVFLEAFSPLRFSFHTLLHNTSASNDLT